MRDSRFGSKQTLHTGAYINSDDTRELKAFGLFIDIVMYYYAYPL
jgi:hypothetical protein